MLSRNVVEEVPR